MAISGLKTSGNKKTDHGERCVQKQFFDLQETADIPVYAPPKALRLSENLTPLAGNKFAVLQEPKVQRPSYG